MGVDKEVVVEQLAGVTPACWVGVWLPRGLKTLDFPGSKELE